MGFVGKHTGLEFEREFVVKTVCESCNTGWMHKLEDANIPILSHLIRGNSKFIDKLQQWSIAVWSIKTAMVLDSATAHAISLFYTQDERDKLRESSFIPERTSVWLGQFHGASDVGASTTEIKTGLPNTTLFPTRISTFLLGSLVVQVSTTHLAPEYSDRTIHIGCAEGPWEYLIAPCWPTRGVSIYWPPILAVNFSNTVLDWRRLADRFNLGRNVPLPTKIRV